MGAPVFVRKDLQKINGRWTGKELTLLGKVRIIGDRLSLCDRLSCWKEGFRYVF